MFLSSRWREKNKIFNQSFKRSSRKTSSKQLNALDSLVRKSGAKSNGNRNMINNNAKSLTISHRKNNDSVKMWDEWLICILHINSLILLRTFRQRVHLDCYTYDVAYYFGNLDLYSMTFSEFWTEYFLHYKVIGTSHSVFHV